MIASRAGSPSDRNNAAAGNSAVRDGGMTRAFIVIARCYRQNTIKHRTLIPCTEPRNHSSRNHAL